jgi:hypothetical protein
METGASLRQQPDQASVLYGRSLARFSRRHAALNYSRYTFTFINGLVGWIFFDFFKVFLAMLGLPHDHLLRRGIAGPYKTKQ